MINMPPKNAKMMLLLDFESIIIYFDGTFCRCCKNYESINLLRMCSHTKLANRTLPILLRITPSTYITRPYIRTSFSSHLNFRQYATTTSTTSEKSDSVKSDNLKADTENKHTEDVIQEVLSEIPLTPYQRFAKRAWRVTGWITITAIAIGVGFYYYVDDALKKSTIFSEKVQKSLTESNNVLKYAVFSLEKGWPLLYEAAKKLSQGESEDQAINLMRSVLGEIHDPRNICLLNPNFIQMIVHRFTFFAKARRSLFGYYRNFRESRIDYYFPIVNQENGATTLLKISLVTNDMLYNDAIKNKPKKDGEEELPIAETLVIDSISLVDPSMLIMEYGPDFFESNVSYSLRPEKMLYSWPLAKGSEFMLCNARRNELIVDPILQFIVGSITSPSMTPLLGHLYVSTLPTEILPR